MGFSQAELQSYRDACVADLIREDVRLLFAGINPGLWTAATQTHFAHPGNRFYPALRLAGIIDRDINRTEGMTKEDRCYLLSRGLGNTNLVNRATARADELSPAELHSGRDRLEQTVRRYRPLVVAIAGIGAYRTAFRQRTASVGRQPTDLVGAQLWVVPNPSGLNAHETISSLAAVYAEPALAAGVLTSTPAAGRTPGVDARVL
ncbi:MAG TPA: mismatch-specific DNA-glycosylase [Dermatophilaceae bacterium]|nr:mismatch-specific DNA-glycosylase [Dermatophilaceae bacterium]